MRINTYTYPESSFLSLEKDMGIIVDMIMKNDRLKKMLYYTTRDCLKRPNLTDSETVSLFGKQIKTVPKLYVDGSVLTYLMITFNNFSTNLSNPEFRDNIVEFDIICHFDQWQLQDFELRPYRIAAEIDSMFNNKRLTGLGELEFVGANQILLTDEYAGICLLYKTVHGEEDKKQPYNPKNQKELNQNFDNIFNN